MAPAGKHGRIVRLDEKLIYNGQPIKLWGLNLCYGQCAPKKELARKHAALYAKYGINAVRLHKWADGTPGMGIQSKDSCVEFDPQALDQMDYQVAKFKEAGIYVTLSATFGSQKLGPDDKQYVPFMEEFGRWRNNRVATPHSAVHYSPELAAGASLAGHEPAQAQEPLHRPDLRRGPGRGCHRDHQRAEHPLLLVAGAAEGQPHAPQTGGQAVLPMAAAEVRQPGETGSGLGQRGLRFLRL